MYFFHSLVSCILDVSLINSKQLHSVFPWNLTLFLSGSLVHLLYKVTYIWFHFHHLRRYFLFTCFFYPPPLSSLKFFSLHFLPYESFNLFTCSQHYNMTSRVNKVKNFSSVFILLHNNVRASELLLSDLNPFPCLFAVYFYCVFNGEIHHLFPK